MHFEGSFEVPVPREKVFSFLVNPKKVATIVPDLEDIEVEDEDNFRIRAKVGISFIKGTVNLRLKIAERKPPSYAKLIGHGSGVQSAVDIESSFTLEEKSRATTVLNWAADAKVSGLLVSVGSRLIDVAAKKYIDQITSSLKKKLSQ